MMICSVAMMDEGKGGATVFSTILALQGHLVEHFLEHLRSMNQKSPAPGPVEETPLLLVTRFTNLPST
jgi:hypothetical protein